MNLFSEGLKMKKPPFVRAANKKELDYVY